MNKDDNIHKNEAKKRTECVKLLEQKKLDIDKFTFLNLILEIFQLSSVSDNCIKILLKLILLKTYRLTFCSFIHTF